MVLAGLWFFLGSKDGRAYRFLGWTYLLFLVQMIILKGRIYYVAPIYPMLFAAGAVWIASLVEERHWEWARQAILIPLTVGGMVCSTAGTAHPPGRGGGRLFQFLGHSQSACRKLRLR